jgi:hypothetical protein
VDIAHYRDRPDYTTTLHYWDGKSETFKHCGKCLSIIPGETCEHCSGEAVKMHQQELAELESGVGQSGTE